MADLMSWLATARPGDTLVYHRGLLAADCNGGFTRTARETYRVRRARDEARRLAAEGRVRLVQRRLPEPGAGCEYLAVRTGNMAP